MKLRAIRRKARLRRKPNAKNQVFDLWSEKLYSGNGLLVLMGESNYGRPRLFMLGLPELYQDDGDQGLSLMELRRDGIYVKSMDDDKGHRSVDISFLTGDNQGRRHSGLPLLPFPFTIGDLRRVESGLGIVERISCGYETRYVLESMKKQSDEAFFIACHLLGAESLEEIDKLMDMYDNLRPSAFEC